MLVLRTYPAALGIPSMSPFCIKSMHMLHRSGLSWRPEFTSDPRRTPMRKLPVLVDGDAIIADSSSIRTYLETTYGCDFDAGLSQRDRARGHAIARMAEEHLYFALLQDRWGGDSHWSRLRDVFFAEVPGPLRGFISGRVRKLVLANIAGQGLGRFTPEGLLTLADADLTAIGTLMQGPFLFGSMSTSADYSVAPMIEALAASPGESALKARVASDAALMEYAARVATLLEDADLPALSSAA